MSPSFVSVCYVLLQACVALSSSYRWCLTGTPLQNKPEDIGALFSFLRLAPASNAAVFKRAIGRPIRSGFESGLARLRVLMKSVCLRRTKGILGTKLPPKVRRLCVLGRRGKKGGGRGGREGGVPAKVGTCMEFASDCLFGNADCVFGLIPRCTCLMLYCLSGMQENVKSAFR